MSSEFFLGTELPGNKFLGFDVFSILSLSELNLGIMVNFLLFNHDNYCRHITPILLEKIKNLSIFAWDSVGVQRCLFAECFYCALGYYYLLLVA